MIAIENNQSSLLQLVVVKIIVHPRTSKTESRWLRVAYIAILTLYLVLEEVWVAETFDTKAHLRT